MSKAATRILAVLALAAVAFVRSAGAQAAEDYSGRPAVAGDSVARSIRQAEERGARVLRPTRADSLLYNPRSYTLEWMALVTAGTAARQCLDVGANPVVRSGDFVVGFGVWRSPSGKISWGPIPGSPRGSRSDLVVTAARLGADGESRVYLRHPYEGAEHHYFTGFVMPGSGRWLLVAATGNYWGCFILTV